MKPRTTGNDAGRGSPARRLLLLTILVATAALSLQAGSAFAGSLGFNPQTGVYTYSTNDAQDKSLTNTVIVSPGWINGSTTYTEISYDSWKVGKAYPDSNIEKYCVYMWNTYYACPATQVVIRTGLGDDTIKATPTSKVPMEVEAGAGSDSIVGGLGPDELWGACKALYCPGHGDSIHGGPGNDQLHGGDKTAAFAALDTLNGGGGDDRLDGGMGPDHLWGGADTDLADYSLHTTPVVAWLDDKANDGSFGENDYIHADVEGIRGSNYLSQGDTLYGNDSANVLWGGAGNDHLRGLGGSDYLGGDAGTDYLQGGQGPDALWGGTDASGGVDFADYQDHWKPVSVSLDGEKNDGEVGEGDMVGTDVEGIIGGTGKDLLVGDAHGNTLWGHDGDDTLIGNGGGYSPNNPGLFVSDTLSGNDGNDMIHGGPAGGAPDVIDGGIGIDTVSYELRTDPVKVFLSQAFGGEDAIKNVENARGGTNDDQLFGDDGANWLAGNGGNDTIDGKGGNDVLHGFAGNDSIEGGQGNDVVGGGDDADYLSGGPGGDHIRGHAGFDTVTYAGYMLPVTVTLDDDVYNDGAAGEADKVLADVENVVGGEKDDTIYGSSFTNILWGEGGNDKLFGLGGPDLLDGKAGFDQLDGGDAADACYGEQRTACEN